MPTLPPYSTFRTDTKQLMYPQATSHGNILTFTPPGFKHALNVKFPDSRLAVCDKCKKNFKTRDMCRVRNVHTSAPWSTAYICITVDESCTDETGKYVDKPLTVRMVQWQPFCVKKPFDSKTPVCATCKRTNRTRSFCRDRHRHRHLPWCTVYVLLSALDQTDPSTVVAGASQKVENDEDQENASSGADSGGAKPKAAEDASTAGSDTIASDGDWESDDINEIPESRTFLAKVSSRGSSIHWLDLGEYDPQSDPSLTGHVDPQLHYGGAMAHAEHVQYFQPPVGYTAQAHQNALKSHQQYFFQMHRQQQQQPPPYAFVMPGAHWQQYNTGQGEMTQIGIGAGDPAMTGEVAGPKRGAPEDGYQALQQPQHHHQQQQHQHQQQWALYYGHQGYGQEVPTHTGALLPNEMHNPDHYPVDVAADADDIENKRQRVA